MARKKSSKPGLRIARPGCSHFEFEAQLSIFSQRIFSRKSSPWDNPEPVREELFSAERIEEHARSLAAAQKVTPKPTKGQPLAGRLAENGAILLAAYKSLLQGADEGRAVTPAAEWLIDNYHLIEKQIREIRSDLPAGYYRQLPKLSVGPFAGYPRVFGLAWAFVAHTDSRFDSDMLVGYVRAYQEVQPLTIGELWAVSITLRIVMIENLRRLAEQIVKGRAARRSANDLADRLLGAGGLRAEPLKSRSPTMRTTRARKPSPSSSSTGCAIRTRRSRRR